MYIKRVFILLSIVLCCNFVFSQSKKDFEKKRTKIQRSIDYANELLSANESANKSLNQLKLINKKLYSRESYIEILNSEVRFLNSNIDIKNDSINLLEKQLSGLLSEYEKMILYAARNKTNYEKMIFIFASNDFNQAYRRLLYLQQYVIYRKKQIELIGKTRQILESQKNELINIKKQKNDLLNMRQDENILLLKERGEQTNILKNLNSRIDDLKKQLEKDKKISQALEQSVVQTVAEIKKELARPVTVKPSKKNKPENEDSYDDSGFAKMKGRLTWPTEHGIILNYFGEHPHSFLKGVKVSNNGVDISTTKGAYAKAVYPGVVSKIVSIPGANKAVLLSHDNYYTLYANLESVEVKPGQTVELNQTLGLIFSDDKDDNMTLLQFQIWKQEKKLDPVKWLVHQ